jgi:hypothetical protein
LQALVFRQVSFELRGVFTQCRFLFVLQLPHLGLASGDHRVCATR